MKRNWTWIFFWATLTATPAKAQTIDEILQLIARNNKELQAAKESAQADKLEQQTRNNLDDPTIEYTPFYTRGTSGVSSTELIVTQGFDFPTLYAARRKAGKLQSEAIDRQQQALRQDILLSAKNLCLDLILLNQQKTLLDKRKECADELLALYEKKQAEGEATILEVNKIKLEQMNIQTEVARNHAAHRTALQQLLAMNGNLPLSFSATEYPAIAPIPGYDAIYSEAIAADATILASHAETRAAQEEVKVNRQNWLPKLEIAYRRNTELNEKINGFLVGGSLPIFSNRKKEKIARAQALSAQLRQEDIQLKAEASIQGLYNEIKQLQEAMQAYKPDLLQQSLQTLREAVKEGQLSVIDYYTEAGNIYLNMEAYNETQNRYQKAVAELYKYKL